MINFYSPQAVDRSGTPMFNSPSPYKAEARYLSNNASASSVITVDPDTTVVEVTASGTAALLRWIAPSDTEASVTAANFDHAIAPNQTRRFPIPIVQQGVNSVVGYNAQHGLYNRYAYISNGIGSVIASEFR